mmetsp:Transcript_2425/g.3520  ORF Transcript_2425/g.3520 Transcript_2425/m.3520 type:complete len:754 (+) Transcript_2425:98-2359(+)|eukprot:CAMPEP_0184478286 /NCGR_PEP_ID=MMETSP0113_2-20130426/343_1 /TAXON_ID=91329 /ORGANISM="Norrisiella sphaerica, Strain BC52" /LENGTH=753 /DNA_ID=CAMNT_0026856013 /DNA_START=101 /DNA_END=2362 /DNA_ORIENTATION=+
MLQASSLLKRLAPTASIAVKRLAPLASSSLTRWTRRNYKVYTGDSEFLAGPTKRTHKVWDICTDLSREEIKKGILDVDNKIPSDVNAFPPGYIDKENEVIVGLQTDKPLKRSIKPYGGWRMVKGALESYGYELDPETEEIFKNYRKTHNTGVFDVYTDEMKLARKNKILTGLPDAYGRGRIIGDYRRVAKYGVDHLIKEKIKDKKALGGTMNEESIRLKEELAEQIRALKELVKMAKGYGFDISKPAKNAREATQWLYFGYLGAIKQQDGAAMSLGRIDCFLDEYFEKDLESGELKDESEAQEIIDDFVIKLRLVRHLRTPEYNDLFAGDPQWITMVIGGLDENGEARVTKTSYRILQTLYNLGPGPEPNLTVLWSEKLPENFKKFCAETSIQMSSVQYENDDIMRPRFSDDYGIACCVSAMNIGKQMQFFGARCNLAKLLLYALNGGVDEITGMQVGPKFEPLSEGPLKYEEVMDRYKSAMKWLAELYVNTMNVIHYMHDKYAYESLQMALHDSEVKRFMAFGVAGLSSAADSLAAIKYGTVEAVRDEKGLAQDFTVEPGFPTFGNNDDRVDAIAKDLLDTFSAELKKTPTYRDSEHTLSVLTITSNVVYGKNTGSTPDGRIKGEAFAPGANPMHGRDNTGCINSLKSVAKMSYESCLDGISNTFTVVPAALGKNSGDRQDNLVTLIDGYFKEGAQHLNVNVLNREMLMDAAENPEKYPNLTIRVSGYAVHFNRLTKEQQKEVITRTFHEFM